MRESWDNFWLCGFSNSFGWFARAKKMDPRGMGDGGIIQQLSALAAFAEDHSLVLSTHRGAHNHL